MSYKVTILGKSYELPPRTMAVDREIDKIHELNTSPNARRLDIIPAMYDFVCEVAGVELPDIEEMDTNDIERAATEIILEYMKPSIRLKAEAQIAEAQAVLETKTAKEAIKLVQAQKK